MDSRNHSPAPEAERDRARHIEIRARRVALALAAALLAGLLPFLDLPLHWDTMGGLLRGARAIAEHPLRPIYPAELSDFAHPPLYMYVLALAWRMLGHAPTAFHAVSFAGAAALVFLTWRLARGVLGPGWALVPAALLALSPIVLAQAIQAYLAIPLALLTVAVLDQAAGGRIRSSTAILVVLALTKETGILAVPAVLAGLTLSDRAGRDRRPAVRRLAAYVPVVALPAAALAIWFAYHHHETGWALMAPGREFRNESLRWLWPSIRFLFVARGRWLLTLAAAAGGLAWWRRSRRAPRGSAETLPRELAMHAVLIATYVPFFGLTELLPRYLLPALPSFYILAAAGLKRLPGPAGLGAAALTAGLLLASLFSHAGSFAGYEDSLLFVRHLRAVQAAEAYLQAHRSADLAVCTGWPMDLALSDPDAGYLTGPPLRIQGLYYERELARAKWPELQAAMKRPEGERPRVWFLCGPVSGIGRYLLEFCDLNRFPLEAAFGEGPFRLELRRLEGELAYPPPL